MLQVRAKFVFGVGPEILGSTPCPGATPSPQGQTLCPRGNPFAPGATPLPLGQSFKKWFLKVLWELPGGFSVAQGTLWEPVRFWTPFSEKILQNHCILQCLGAGWNLNRIHRIHRIHRIQRIHRKWSTSGSSHPRFLAPEARMTVVKQTPSNE